MAPVSDAFHAADVIVIGGGVIGCSIALRLAQAKLHVTVIERGEPGSEASSAAAGMLAPQGETSEPSPFFDLCLNSRNLYPRFVAEIQDLSGNHVSYHSEGTALVAIEEKECRELEQVYTVQTRLGLRLERLTAKAVSELVPGLSSQIRCGLFIQGDHWVDNQHLSRALTESCRRIGVAFRTRSEVKGFKTRNNRIESVQIIGDESSHSSFLSAPEFVLAAGCWSGELAAALGTPLPMKPCRGQMIEFECPTDFPVVVRLGHHYLVPRPPGRILAGTTMEYVGYDKAVTAGGLHSILEGTTRITPQVSDFRLSRTWAGLRPDTADHLPILGYGEFENLIFATGHFRNGILLAPLTAQFISELLLNRSTPKAIQPYSPGRFIRA
jgi:glycine oxidase